MLKPIDMEPLNAVPKKPFVSDEEFNLTPQDRIGNIDWCKYGCECKLMATFAESFCLLLRLNSAREASYHSAFMGSCPTISYKTNIFC